jgi:hypothetical protein
MVLRFRSTSHAASRKLPAKQRLVLAVPSASNYRNQQLTKQVHTSEHPTRKSIKTTHKPTPVMADTKISPYSLPDLKNTTDDALGNYLRGIGFKQDNSKTDIKLVVGYLAVIIAGATFVADYKLGWEATKGWTAVAVAAYAILNGVFTYWLWFVEAGLVFEGSKDGKKVGLSSFTRFLGEFS